jgi:serine/threonine protein kinase
MVATIGMGGSRRDYIQFGLKWHARDYADAVEMAKNAGVATRQENPQIARTVEEADTVLPTQRQTRIHTHVAESKLRYEVTQKLGAGQYGNVYKATNLDTGKLMAVKIFKSPATVTDGEIEILSKIRHVSEDS